MGRPSSAAGRCRYCGAAVMYGSVCRACLALEEADPQVAASLGPLTEEEHGVRPPWPEGELEDDVADQ